MEKQERPTTRVGPREKLIYLGEQACSDVDLLAVLLGTGVVGRSVFEVAGQIVWTVGGLAGLAQRTVQELADIGGIGPARAARLRAALELGRRATRSVPAPGTSIRTARDVARVAGPALADRDRECFLVLLLDVRHRVFREELVSVGTLTTAPVDPREVYSSAIRHRAAAVCVAHNHPSGDPTPSREDHEVTRRLQLAGDLLGIPLLDHVVVAGEGFTSFVEEGWLK
ncbi:MAG: DNA repair protein RadC [Planctomycetes bacterium]|nr:DNA repair protein RadC [Planctomycetota bacterium]